MPIEIRISLPGAGPGQHDALLAALGFPRDLPAGLLVHTAAARGDGVEMTQVWEDRAAFDAFRAGRLDAALASLGGGLGATEVREAALHAAVLSPSAGIPAIAGASAAIHRALLTDNLDLRLGAPHEPAHYLGRLTALGLVSDAEAARLAEVIEPLTGHRTAPEPDAIPAMSRAIRADAAVGPVASAIAGVVEDSIAMAGAATGTGPLLISDTGTIVGHDALGALIGGVSGAVAGEMVGGPVGAVGAGVFGAVLIGGLASIEASHH